MLKLADNAKVFEQSGIIAAGTDDTTNFTGCDVKDCEGFAVLARMGTITATAVTTLIIQESDDNSTYTNISGASTTIAADDDDLVSVCEVHRPLLAKRYARGILVRATANVELDGAVGLGLGPDQCPVTQDTTSHVGAITTKP